MKMLIQIAAIYLLIVFFIQMDTLSQQKISFEFCTGLPINIPLPLHINQKDEKALHITARYNSEPFNIPIYWNWRITLWNCNRGWELEATHHKIFLDNKPQEVDQFQVSHGLNFVNINRVWEYNRLILRTGLGIILAHPENIIRGKPLSEDGGLLNWGYYLTGPVINFSVGSKLNLIGRSYFLYEVKTNLAFARVPVADGNADLYNAVIQLNFGLGLDIGF